MSPYSPHSPRQSPRVPLAPLVLGHLYYVSHKQTPRPSQPPGGHGGAADNKQRAHMWALTYTFLAQTLGLDGETPPVALVDSSDGKGTLRSLLLESEYSPRV